MCPESDCPTRGTRYTLAIHEQHCRAVTAEMEELRAGLKRQTIVNDLCTFGRKVRRGCGRVRAFAVRRWARLVDDEEKTGLV